MEGRTRETYNFLGRATIRGEMPIELKDSWFSVKTIEVVRRESSGMVQLHLHEGVKFLPLGNELRISQTLSYSPT